MFETPESTNNTEPTQCAAVLAWLEVFETITPRQAIQYLDVYRLAARVFELRQAGHDIRTDTPAKGAKYAIYRLVAARPQHQGENHARDGSAG